MPALIKLIDWFFDKKIHLSSSLFSTTSMFRLWDCNFYSSGALGIRRTFLSDFQLTYHFLFLLEGTWSLINSVFCYFSYRKICSTHPWLLVHVSNYQISHFVLQFLIFLFNWILMKGIWNVCHGLLKFLLFHTNRCISFEDYSCFLFLFDFSFDFVTASFKMILLIYRCHYISRLQLNYFRLKNSSKIYYYNIFIKL